MLLAMSVINNHPHPKLFCSHCGNSITDLFETVAYFNSSEAAKHGSLIEIIHKHCETDFKNDNKYANAHLTFIQLLNTLKETMQIRR